MNFDAAKALEYARGISFPRGVGSEGEKAAAETIWGWFSGLGYEVDYQEFQFSDALERVMKLEILLVQLLVISGLVGRYSFPAGASLSAGLVLLVLAAIPIVHRAILDSSVAISGNEGRTPITRFTQRLGRPSTGVNVIAGKKTYHPDDRRTHLVLMAHYDTKSQTISLPVRVLLLLLAITGGLVYGIAGVVVPLYPAAADVSTAAGILAVVSATPLLFLQTGNQSPGGLDNASGVGVMIHLAELLASRPDILERVSISFVATSAEEFALMGARAFLETYLNPSKRGGREAAFYLLNLDGTGTDGRLNISGRSRRYGRSRTLGLGDMVERCCDDLSIPAFRYNLPGLMMDHMPFAQAGLEAVSLTTLGASALAVHTAGDRADKLSILGTDRAGRVGICLIQKLTELQ